MKFGHLEGVPQPYLGDLLIMVINHLLIGMILQAGIGVKIKNTFNHHLGGFRDTSKSDMLGCPPSQ